MGRLSAQSVNISRLHFPVTTLGPGRRVGIWFQGCSIRCQGCLSMDTWSPGEGVPVRDVVERIAGLADSLGVDGITISGGEPFDQPQALEALLTGIGQSVALERADVLVYSGYTLSVIKRRHARLLALADALMTGPFVASRPTNLAWRGSSNQVLTCLSERARKRFTNPEPCRRVQVSVDGGKVWMIGIPAQGDLERLESSAAERGVELEAVSWRL
jgi:anaerobic ribonucleoside-triphosphate reductase activating protein